MYEDVWTPGEPFVATCRAGGAHRSPELGCSCGVYALRGRTGLERYLVGRDDSTVVCRLVGEVELWGLVLEGDAGWRAELAYPRRLVIDREDVAEGLADYGTKISLVFQSTNSELVR